MAETNLALASLMPRPQATQDMASVADMMRARNLAPFQQNLLRQQAQEGQARTGLIGEQTEAERIQNQMQRQLLGAYSDPDIWKAPAAAAPSGGGTTPSNVVPAVQETSAEESDPVAMINGLFERAAAKYNPIVAQKVVAPFLEHYKTLQDMTAKQQDVYTKAHQALGDGLASVKNSVNQAEALADFQAELKKNPIPGLPPNELAEVEGIGPEHLDATINALRFSSQVTEASSKKTALLKSQQETAVPTDQDRQNAINTTASYAKGAGGELPPAMVAGFAQELQSAPTQARLEKIQDRIAQANESFQRSADARQQALAMKDVAKGQIVAGQLVKQDEKLGDALNQTAGIRQLLDMSKGGNEVATAAAQTRFAEHEIVEGGVKRMNQVEYQNLATSLGDYGRRWSAWVDKGMKGQMPEATNAEMGKILDAEDSAAHSAHERSVGYTVDRYLKGSTSTEAAVPKTEAQGGKYPQGITLPQGWSWTTHSDGRIGITDGKNFRPYNAK